MNPRRVPKYAYIRKTPTWLVRTIYVFGISTWLLVVYGYSRFIIIDPVYFWLLSPLLLFFTIYYLTSYGINLFYTQFNLPAHFLFIRKFWLAAAREPTVDVFLPICGEDTKVVRKTFIAVAQLNYKNKKVFVLDDKGNPEHKALAAEHHFTYLCRPDRGRMKKAGNIKYGFDRSQGEFIVIFDADFAPHPNFIKILLPYMSDTNVAIIQTPQYFETDARVHRRSALEYGAAHVQEDFYRFIQVARSNLGAPICCGSNAVYRRAALDTIGGTAQVEHSEDMHTGFDLTNRGWRVKFIPIILAVGICPDNLHPYFHQQHRWCSGSLSLMLDKKFWRSRLTIIQKMCFISGFMYYLSFPLTVVLSFQAFVVLFRYSHFVSWRTSIPFIPCIIFSFIVMPLFRIGKARIGNFMARTANGYAYSHAVVTSFIRRSVGWQPTNGAKTSISKPFRSLVAFNALYLFTYVTLIGVAIHRNQFQIFNPSYYSVLFWVCFNLFASTLSLYNFYRVFIGVRQAEVKQGALSAPLFGMWRIQTAGMYVLLLVMTLTFTLQYGTF